jgi:hypothetical protein
LSEDLGFRCGHENADAQTDNEFQLAIPQSSATPEFITGNLEAAKSARFRGRLIKIEGWFSLDLISRKVISL